MELRWIVHAKISILQIFVSLWVAFRVMPVKRNVNCLAPLVGNADICILSGTVHIRNTSANSATESATRKDIVAVFSKRQTVPAGGEKKTSNQSSNQQSNLPRNRQNNHRKVNARGVYIVNHIANHSSNRKYMSILIYSWLPESNWTQQAILQWYQTKPGITWLTLRSSNRRSKKSTRRANHFVWWVSSSATSTSTENCSRQMFRHDDCQPQPPRRLPT